MVQDDDFLSTQSSKNHATRSPCNIETFVETRSDVELTMGQIHCRLSVILNEARVTGRKSRIFGYMSRGDSVCGRGNTSMV